MLKECRSDVLDVRSLDDSPALLGYTEFKSGKEAKNDMFQLGQNRSFGLPEQSMHAGPTERTFVTAIIVEQHSARKLEDTDVPMEAKMNDRYTKTVLTVIALALTIIAARDWLPVKPATAQNGPVHVIVDGVDPFAFQRTVVPVKVANYW